MTASVIMATLQQADNKKKKKKKKGAEVYSLTFFITFYVFFLHNLFVSTFFFSVTLLLKCLLCIITFILISLNATVSFTPPMGCGASKDVSKRVKTKEEDRYDYDETDPEVCITLLSLIFFFNFF